MFPCNNFTIGILFQLYLCVNLATRFRNIYYIVLKLAFIGHQPRIQRTQLVLYYVFFLAKSTPYRLSPNQSSSYCGAAVDIASAPPPQKFRNV